MKVAERVLGRRLRQAVEIDKMQFGFRPGTGTTDAIFIARQLQELKEKLRKWNECLKDKGLNINKDKTKVMCESFSTDITQVIGNVKHPM